MNKKDNTQAGKKSGIAKKLLSAKELGAILPMIIIVLLASVLNPGFLAASNAFDILRTASYTFILGVPVTFLLASGRMDLSVGATVSLGGVIAAMAEVAGLPTFVAIFLGIAAGALIGTLNALIVEKFGMPAFIATMGMQYVITGIVSVITGNNSVSGISKAFKAVAQTRLGNTNFSVVILYALLFGIIGHIVLRRSKYGREVLAVGGNVETAFLAGINPRKRHSQLYILTGMMAALLGVLYCSRFSSAQVSAGSGTELTIIASVIIGGTSMFGGSGTILGSALGCILFAMITNALIVVGVSTYWQKVVYGAILILALFIDEYRRRKLAGE